MTWRSLITLGASYLIIHLKWSVVFLALYNLITITSSCTQFSCMAVLNWLKRSWRWNSSPPVWIQMVLQRKTSTAQLLEHSSRRDNSTSKSIALSLKINLSRCWKRSGCLWAVVLTSLIFWTSLWNLNAFPICCNNARHHPRHREQLGIQYLDQWWKNILSLRVDYSINAFQQEWSGFLPFVNFCKKSPIYSQWKALAESTLVSFWCDRALSHNYCLPILNRCVVLIVICCVRWAGKAFHHPPYFCVFYIESHTTNW